jgi:predicted RNase H-like HicB family nuclease
MSESEPIYFDRDEAVEELDKLKGRNLRELAEEYGVFYYGKKGRINRNWFTDTLEMYLGLPKKSLRNDVWKDDKRDPAIAATKLTRAQTDSNPEMYRIIVGWSPLEQHYVAWIPELRKWGVASAGDTPEQAIEGLRRYRDSTLRFLKEHGYPIPKPMYVRIVG